VGYEVVVRRLVLRYGGWECEGVDLGNCLSGFLGVEHTPFSYYTEGQHGLLWF
jgi:hypothetical protein